MRKRPIPQTATRRLQRPGPRPMALEQRFMFDGAAVADAVGVVCKPLEAEFAPPHAAAPEARVPTVVETARQQAQRQVVDFLNQPDALQQLFTVFNGGQLQPSQAWLSAAQALLDNRDADHVDVQLRSQAEMRGALGAFAAAGPGGKPAIFLNADWLERGADTATVTRVLVEEIGHSLDSRLNGAADTRGDEGEAFSVVVAGQHLSAAEQQRIATENDHGSITIDGVNYAVEDAAVTFTQAYTGIPSALSEEASSLNGIAVLTPFGGTGFQFVSANPGDPYFSGNNVSGYLQYKDAGGVDQNIYGVVSRQFKTNGVTNGFYFYASGADGVIGTGDAGEVAYLLVVDPAKFSAGGNYGTSSDPVDTALNNYLNHYTPASAVADTVIAVEQGGLGNASGGSNATGNVLGNDAGSASPLVSAAGTSTASTSVSTTLAGGGTTITGAYGTLTIGTDGNFSYVVNNGNAAVQALRLATDTLTDSFTYRITDTHSPAAVSTARLTVTIQGANDTPLATADVGYAKVSLLTDGTAYGGADNIGTKSTGNVLYNDTDVDKYGETRTVAGLTASGDYVSYTAGGSATSLTFTGSNGSFYRSVNIGDYLYTGKISNSYYLLKTSSDALIQVTSKSTNADGTYSIGLSGNIHHFGTNTAFTITGGTTVIDFYPDSTRNGANNLPSGKEATVNTATAVQYSTVTLSGITGNVVVGMTATGTNIPAGAKVAAISGSTITLDKILSSAPSGTISFLAAGGATVNGTLGTLVLNSDGSYIYTPLPDAAGGTSGSDAFTYTMQDAGGFTSTATLTINVQASSASDPNARDDVVTGTEQGAAAGVNPAGNVFTGTITSGSGTGTADSAGSGATFGANPVTSGRTAASASSTAIGAGSHVDFAGLYGTLRLYSTGAYTYTIDNANPAVNALNSGASLSETFFYTTTNSLAKTDTATLTVTINGANDAPVAVDDLLYAVEDTPVTFSAADLTGNDSDVDSGTLTLVSVTSGTGGTVVKNGDGTVTFTPTANFNGNATFTYTVSDGVTTSTGNVTVVVAAANDYPVARDNAYTTPLNTLLASRNVITNNDGIAGTDSDIETGTASLTISRVNGTAFTANGVDAGHLAADGWMQVALSHGTLYIKADGSTEYAPANGDTAGDNFTYTVTDGSGESDPATVHLNVTAVATPTVSVSNVTVSEASPYVVFEISLDIAGGSAISFTPVLNSGSGTVGTDTGASGALEYFNGTSWVSAAGGITLNAGTTSVLVRTAVTADNVFEGSESFTLDTGAITGTVTNAVGASGTGTIKDDGSSTNVFLASNNTATPAAGTADDDTPTISVGNVTVSEASPYAVFQVSLNRASTGAVSFTPALTSGSGTVGTDTGASGSLEYFNGAAWVSAAGGITLSPGATSVLVRTAVTADNVFEGSESFTLDTGAITGTVTNAVGASGTGTIKDDGSSTNVFLASNNTATPATGTADDDTPTISVGNVTVSEASPYAVFQVSLNRASTGAISFTPALTSGSGTVGTDTGASGALEYFNGTSWVSAAGGITLNAGTTSVLVRTVVTADNVFEGSESFTLDTGAITGTVTNAVGASGTGTIKDDGSSTNVFLGSDNTATPSAGTADNDTPSVSIAVSPASMNEDAAGVLTYTITLSNPAAYSTTVNYTLAGTASAGGDFSTTGAGTLIIAAGSTTGSFAVDPVADTTVEPNETIIAMLASASSNGVALSLGGAATGTLLNDDTAVAPTIVVASDKATLKAGETATLTFILSESSSDFTAADVSVTGGTLSGFTGSGANYTATFTPAAASTTTAAVHVASGAFTGAGGTANADGAEADNTATMTVDTARPSIAVSTSSSSLKLGETATLTFTLSEPSNDFDASDIAVTGGTLSGFSGSGTSYTATFTPSSAGGSVAVASGRFSDATGNLNADGADADNAVAIAYDGVRPTVVVTSDKTALKAGQTATLTFTLSEPSTDFDASDIAVTGGTLSGFSGSGTRYTATFTPSGTGGSVSVASGRFSDAARNLNADGSDADNAVAIAYDGVQPTVVVTSDKSALKTGETATLTFTLSEPSTNFDASDIAVTGGTLSGFSGSGTRYTATFTPSAPGAASVSVPSAAFSDTAGNGNADGSDADNHLEFSVTALVLPTVSSPVVNEASPFAVFTVSGTPGEAVSLVLTAGSATDGGVDFAGGPLQVSLDSGRSWIDYGGLVTLPAGGALLVRAPVVDDAISDNDESFTLTVTAPAGPAVGTATLKDDGTGSIFRPDGSIDAATLRSDDRPVSVSSPTVNEATETAVFTVSGSAGQTLSLQLSAGSATGGGTDFGSGLEVSLDGGLNWTAYAGSLTLPARGSALVRTPVTNDNLPDNGETFTLTATPVAGRGATGTATLRDDGTGSVFKPDGSIDVGATLDDDRPLGVNSPTISEASPYLMFKVSGAAGQLAELALESGTATVGADTGTALEVLDGTAWRAYVPGSRVALGVNGELLVRVAVANDSVLEGSESLRLAARNTSGTRAVGTATVKDDGSSAHAFTANNITGQPTQGLADDDSPRPVDPPAALPAPAPAPVEPPAPAVPPSPPAPPAAVPPVFVTVERGVAEAAAAQPSRIADTLTESSGFRVVVVEAAQPQLTVFMGITDQFVEKGQPSSFTLPADAFAHTRPEASINLTAKRADGADLPAWVQFDARAGTFSVDPPPEFDGELQLVVIARDAEGREARTLFKMSVGKGKKMSFGRPGFSEQMRSAAAARPAWEVERGARMRA